MMNCREVHCLLNHSSHYCFLHCLVTIVFYWLCDYLTCVLISSRFKVNMSAFPIISRIHGTLCELEAFQQSHPLNQPDCPPELK